MLECNCHVYIWKSIHQRLLHSPSVPGSSVLAVALSIWCRCACHLPFVRKLIPVCMLICGYSQISSGYSKVLSTSLPCWDCVGRGSSPGGGCWWPWAPYHAAQLCEHAVSSQPAPKTNPKCCPKKQNHPHPLYKKQINCKKNHVPPTYVKNPQTIHI